MQVFVGLDLSLTSTGLAILSGSDVTYHSFGYALKKSDSNAVKVKRYISLTQSIMSKLQPYAPYIHTIALEDYAYTQQIAYVSELGGIVKSQIYLSLKKTYVSLPCTTVRKILLGHSKKIPDIKNEVARKLKALGFASASNLDESDALAVAWVTRHLLTSGELSKDQQKVRDTLLKQKHGERV